MSISVLLAMKVAIFLDKHGKSPLYFQLSRDLMKKIDNGQFPGNTKLPSERVLCDMYELSRITVRQALEELAREGYIYKAHGKGSFVAPKTYNQPLVKLYSFTEEMKALGKKPSTEVIHFGKLTIDERLAEKMGLDPGDNVFQVVRLRLADGEALLYETSYLPCDLFPDLTGDALRTKPMYDIFYDDYGYRVTRATERFSATVVQEGEAEQLQISERQPAMQIKRYAYHRAQLLEYTVSIARGDKFEYTVELES
ncbi:MAG TPA: GntR family transcriptional regulator [Virgibacillus sp.]|nr:GntR family transcriptional regulator [Virgibacillus sp.]